MNKKTMKLYGFDKCVERMEHGFCVQCAEPVSIGDFKDKQSIKEYKISGLCQACQVMFSKLKGKIMFNEKEVGIIINLLREEISNISVDKSEIVEQYKETIEDILKKLRKEKE